MPTPCVDSNPDDDEDECDGNGGEKPPQPPQVPEPEGWLLLALAGLAVGWAFRRGVRREIA